MNVPVGAALAAAAAEAPAPDDEPAPGAAEAGADGDEATFAQAAAIPPIPSARLAAPVTFRNWRRLYSRIRSVIERSSSCVFVPTQSAMIAASSAGHQTHTSSPSSWIG